MNIHFRYPQIVRGLKSSVILAVMLCGLSSGAAADTVLKRLEGDWRGSGSAVVGSGSAPVRVRCKTTNQLTDGDRVLTLSGACSSAQGRRRVNARFELGQDGKAIRHASITVGTRTSEANARVINGNSIRFEAQVSTPGGLIEQLRSVITVAEAKYTFVTSRLSGGQWIEQSRIVFKR